MDGTNSDESEQAQELGDFEALRSSVSGKWARLAFPVRIHRCIKYIEDHIEDLPQIGIKWISNNTFLINASILSSLFGCNRNALNKIFRAYQFNLLQSETTMAEIRTLPWPKDRPLGNWSKREFKGGEFNPIICEATIAAMTRQLCANRREFNRDQVHESFSIQIITSHANTHESELRCDANEWWDFDIDWE
jgi:hypothetical protein